MSWSPAASSSQQRARVLTDVKARRFAPPPLRGADGLDAGSAPARPDWLLPTMLTHTPPCVPQRRPSSSPHSWCRSCGARASELGSDRCRVCIRGPVPIEPPEPCTNQERRRQFQADRTIRRRQERSAAGMCVTCGRRPADEWRTRCVGCHVTAVATGRHARRRRRELTSTACTHGASCAAKCPQCRACVDARLKEETTVQANGPAVETTEPLNPPPEPSD